MSDPACEASPKGPAPVIVVVTVAVAPGARSTFAGVDGLDDRTSASGPTTNWCGCVPLFVILNATVSPSLTQIRFGSKPTSDVSMAMTRGAADDPGLKPEPPGSGVEAAEGVADALADGDVEGEADDEGGA